MRIAWIPILTVIKLNGRKKATCTLRVLPHKVPNFARYYLRSIFRLKWKHVLEFHQWINRVAIGCINTLPTCYKNGGIDGRRAHLFLFDKQMIPLFIFYPVNLNWYPYQNFHLDATIISLEVLSFACLDSTIGALNKFGRPRNTSNFTSFLGKQSLEDCASWFRHRPNK